MLTGFYHPARFGGVPWFPRSAPSPEYLAGLPAGTITDVPTKPGDNYTYNPGTNSWVHNPPSVTVEQVKAEAERRILLVAEDWKQRNIMARSIELLNKIRNGGTLTAEEQAEETAALAIWAGIKAIRQASNLLEAMDPIPADYATNATYWP